MTNVSRSGPSSFVCTALTHRRSDEIGTFANHSLLIRFVTEGSRLQGSTSVSKDPGERPAQMTESHRRPAPKHGDSVAITNVYSE